MTGEPDWSIQRADRRGGYLGKLELIARLMAELEGERRLAMREASRYDATVEDIAAASLLKPKAVRELLK